MGWSNFAFPVARQSDEQIIDGLIGALSEGPVEFRTLYVVLDYGPEFSIPAAEVKTSEVLRSVLATNSMNIRNLRAQSTLRGRSVDVNVVRDYAQPSDNVTIQLADLVHATQDQVLIKEVGNFVQRVKKNLVALASRGGLGKIIGEEAKLFYERRETDLQRIESLGSSMLEQLGRRITDTRVQLEEEYRTRRAHLEAEYQINHDRLHKESEERRKRLEEKENAYQVRLAEIDDRNARHVRREIRREQKKELEASSKNFTLTSGTVALRQPIAGVCKVLLWVFGIGAAIFTLLNAYLAFSSISLSTAMWVALGIKQSALTTGLVTTAVFYIRWNNRWFEQHATEEFRLKRLSLDLDRASWLVETAMEWKEEKGTEIPNILVERLSSGLFEPDAPKDTPLHPADQLASALLGASSEVSLETPGGSKLRLDRKGLRSLQKEAGKAE